jgi:hypothetical protein
LLDNEYILHYWPYGMWIPPWGVQGLIIEVQPVFQVILVQPRVWEPLL